MKTKAIVFAAKGRVELMELAMPVPAEDEVVIQTTYSGISIGTETWHLNNRHQWMKDGFPFVPGYQKAGVIVEAGRKVKDFKTGQRVFYQGGRLDKTCGVNPDGPNGHTEYSIAGTGLVIPLADPVDDKGAALGAMAAVGCVGVKLSQIQKGELVVVNGQGLIGQMAAQAARRRGAFVITSDIVPLRVALSQKYSADLAVNGKESDLRAIVAQKNANLADVAVDTTGRSDMYAYCLKLIRWEGRISLQGYYPEKIVVDFHDSHARRAIVNFPCGWDHADLVECLGHLADGSAQLAPLVTQVFRPEQCADAFQFIQEKPQECLGVLFDWK